MGSINDNWLPHLSPEVISETEGNYLDAYVVALEGWRRGLTLRWHVKDSEKFKEMKTWFVEEPGQLFSLESDEKTHYFFRTRGDKVTNKAVEQGMNKQITKEMLSKKGVPVPEGREFAGNYTENNIISYASSLGFPVVIKPKDGSFGRGVASNIKNTEELKVALEYLQGELNENEIIVEKHIRGNDYRLYVVGNKVEGAILRIAPNVIGDGESTIDTLIKNKNALRRLNPRLISCPVRSDDEAVDYLNQSDYNLDTIPQKGEVVYLNDKANISLGGDPVDVLDDLSSNIKDIAIKALNTIPGLKHGAVDLMIETNSQGEESGYVIELNPTAQLGGILFPLQGEPRDVPSAIIDYYFPESKKSNRNLKTFFDFQEVLFPLIQGTAQVTKLSNCESENVDVEKVILKGDFQEVKLVYSIRSLMNKLNLSGYINVDSETEIEIVVMGNSMNIKTLKKELEVENIIVKETSKNEVAKKQIKSGVEIKDTAHDLINDIKKLEQDASDMKKYQHRLEKEYNNMLRSNSWKITAPIRKITGGIKQLIKR